MRASTSGRLCAESADIELYVRKFVGKPRLGQVLETGSRGGSGTQYARRASSFARDSSSGLRSRPSGGGRNGPAENMSERAETLSETSLRCQVGLRSHPVVRLLEVDSPKQRALRCLSLLAPAPRHWTHPSGRQLSWAGVWFGRYGQVSAAWALAAAVSFSGMGAAANARRRFCRRRSGSCWRRPGGCGAGDEARDPVDGVVAAGAMGQEGSRAR